MRSTSDADFVPETAKKTGARGAGYYRDSVQHSSAAIQSVNAEETASLKRKLNESVESKKRSAISSSAVPSMKIDGNKDSSEDLDSDLDKVRQLILSLEKKINANQTARIRFADNPAKFADSEVDLYEAVQAIQSMAATPETYKTMIELRTIESFIGLLTHENIDISSTIVSLLEEMSQPNDTSQENQETIKLCSFIQNHQGLEVLVQNLFRLHYDNDIDTSDKEEAILNNLLILDHFIDLMPITRLVLCERTRIIEFLLIRLMKLEFDESLLQASELIFNLLQTPDNTQNSQRLCQRVYSIDKGSEILDGLTIIAQKLKLYLARNAGSKEEEEMTKNLFNAICHLFYEYPKEAKIIFRNLDGVQLLLTSISLFNASSIESLKALDFFLTGNDQLQDILCDCQVIVERGSVKDVIDVCTGKHKFNMSVHGDADRHESIEERKQCCEYGVSILSSICLHLTNSCRTAINQSSLSASSQFVHKLSESGCKRLRKLLLIFVSNWNIIDMIEKETRDGEHIKHIPLSSVQGLTSDDLIDLADDFKSSKDLGGRSEFLLQRIAIVVAYACSLSSDCQRATVDAFSEAGLPEGCIQKVLRDRIDVARDDKQEWERLTLLSLCAMI